MHSQANTRTRHSHRQLDGEKVEVGKKFSNGLRYPADPNGSYAEIMNCRCTLIAALDGINDAGKRWSKLPKGMTYEQWKRGKKFTKTKGANGLKIATQSNNTKAGKGIINPSKAYKNIVDAAISKGIDYNPVTKLKKKLSESEIIRRLAGGDITKGSCSSLAFAYIGNKCGLDVLDFRGGDSSELFSYMGTICDIANFKGIKGQILNVKKEVRETEKALRGLKLNKEYYLATGKHAAIVRNNGGRFEYLELQSRNNSENGWQPLQNNTLNSRFGAAKSQRTSYGFKLMSKIAIIDVSSFRGCKEFENILGYINTDKTKQLKGAGGYVK